MSLASVNMQPGRQRARRATCCAALGLLACLAPLRLLACPDLQPYYPASAEQWPALVPQLAALMPQCLDTAEYFALMGAAQLNTGQLPAALEALERALLLDPNNGAARIDYAEGLHAAGQLFPALEMNRSLLQRQDLPPNLVTMLEARQQTWQSQTRSREYLVEMAAGYDDNLNGAPSRSDFTLTLSGEPILVTLDPEYQPLSGSYLNLRVGGLFRKTTPEHSRDLLLAIRGRVSEYSDANLLQAEGRYALAIPLRRYQWDLSAGASHLQFGGSSLYSVTEGRVRLGETRNGCRPGIELAAQHQYFHGQTVMSGLESSASGGVECRTGSGRQLFGVEAGVLSNLALDNDRPGGDRLGWKLQMTWLLQLGQGAVSTQFSYSKLEDASGYSGLLANGAIRTVHNRLFRLQYSRPLQPGLTFITNLNHQGQGSNIAPFENAGTSLDMGLNLSF